MNSWNAWNVAALVLVLGVSACERRGSVELDGGLNDGGVESNDGGSELAIRGVDPTHGPFDRSTLAVIEGAGFGPSATVTVDGVSVADAVVRSSGRITLRMPPHAPGVVPVAVTDRGRTFTLERAFSYDALSVEPEEGSTLGGTRVVVRVAGQVLQPGDQFVFQGRPCTDLELLADDRARCITPSAAAAGAVAVQLRRAEEARITATEAFRYREATAVGGIAGGPIDGELRVRAVSWRGEIEEALVQVVTRDGTLEARTGDDGWATVTRPGLDGPVTVHVGHPCYGLTSLVDIDARSVVAPLPLGPANPDCPQPEGGGFFPAVLYGTFRGVAQFPSREEFGAPGAVWNGVPAPGPGEVRALYAGYDDGLNFQYIRFSEDDYDPSVQGFPFEGPAPSGGTRLRAIAGIEPEGNDVGFAGAPNERFLPFVIGESAPVLIPADAPTEQVPVSVRTALGERFELSIGGTDGDAVVNTYASYGVTFRSSFGPVSAPTRFEVRRLPREADFWEHNEVLVNVGVQRVTSEGEQRFSGALLFMDDYVPAYSFVALPPIDIVRPVPRVPGLEAIELASPGEFDLLRLTLNGPRMWLILARGTVRVIDAIDSDDPALALPPGDYDLSVEGDRSEGFDFDAFDFEVLANGIGINSAMRTPEGLRVLRTVRTDLSPILLR
jgi:hypothetical protein